MYIGEGSSSKKSNEKFIVQHNPNLFSVSRFKFMIIRKNGHIKKWQ